MNLLETVQEIQRKAVQAELPRQIKVEKDPPEVERYWNGSVLETIHAAAPSRAHRVETFGALEVAVAMLEGELADEEGISGVSVWHSKELIQAVAQNRFDMASMPLEISEEMQWLEKHTGTAIEQRELIWTLRTTFHGQDEELLRNIRNVRIKSVNASHSEIRHGDESLGKSVELEISGGNGIPETFSLAFPLYYLPELSYVARVTCALDLNHQHGKFRIAPLPGELTRVLDEAQDEIHDLLTSALPDEVKVLRGRF